jgi:hypothetical protein
MDGTCDAMSSYIAMNMTTGLKTEPEQLLYTDFNMGQFLTEPYSFSVLLQYLLLMIPFQLYSSLAGPKIMTHVRFVKWVLEEMKNVAFEGNGKNDGRNRERSVRSEATTLKKTTARSKIQAGFQRYS